MSSKKILAASMAAVLATGTIAVVASAANTDYEWTISGEKMGAEKVTKAVLSVASKNMALTDAKFQAVANATDQSKNAYSTLKVGLWQAFEEFNITAMSGVKLSAEIKGKVNYAANPFIDEGGLSGAAQTDKYGTVWAAKDANGDDVFPLFTVTTESDAGASSGDAKIVLTWVGADGETASDFTDATGWTAPTGTYTSLSNDDLAEKLKAYVKEVNAAMLKTVSVSDGASGLATKDVTATAEADVTGSWRKAQTGPDGSTTDPASGWVNGTGAGAKFGQSLGPVDLNLSFDLADGERLALDDTTANSLAKISAPSLTLTGTFTVDGDTYYDFVDGKYGVAGAFNWNNGWDDNGSTFVQGNTSKYGFAVLAQSGVDTSAVEGVAIKDDLTEEPDLTKEKGDLTITKDGDALVDFAKLISPTVMKNLNNGGTVTFKFNKDFSISAWEYGYVVYWNGAQTIPLSTDFGYELSGNEITFNIPAGLTYDEGTVNAYKPFILKWNFNKNLIDSGTIWADGTPDDADYDGDIVSITFKANGAPDAPSVGDGENSGNNGGNTSNPGSTSGNPNTGIALAVAPIVLAAGAVVTIASKKRK